jgi:hypothetical protein
MNAAASSCPRTRVMGTGDRSLAIRSRRRRFWDRCRITRRPSTFARELPVEGPPQRWPALNPRTGRGGSRAEFLGLGASVTPKSAPKSGPGLHSVRVQGSPIMKSRGGELSTGKTGNFQPDLTRSPLDPIIDLSGRHTATHMSQQRLRQQPSQTHEPRIHATSLARSPGSRPKPQAPEAPNMSRSARLNP